MIDLENPYASPQTPQLSGTKSRPVRTRRFPSVSLAMTILLWVNMAAIAFLGLLILGAYLFPNDDDETWSIFQGALVFIWAPWMVFGWPIASLAPLVYAVTIDFQTKFYVLKWITAFVMLSVWIAGIAGALIF